MNDSCVGSILRAGALLGTLCWKLILDALKIVDLSIETPLVGKSA